jgi:DNA polymerase/3'-5' exonuclease PolX
MAKRLEDLAYLQEIYGIGPVSAKTLLASLTKKKFVWSNKEELYEILRKPEILKALPESAQAYLLYMPDRAIPNSVMRKFDTALHKLTGAKFVIAGSYRRGKPFSRDVDIVMIKTKTNSNYLKFRNALESSKIVKILKIYAAGNLRISIMFLFRNPTSQEQEKKSYVIKADVFLTPPKEYMYTLLYATGSGTFNIRMRAQAKRKGYLLNQRGLFDSEGNLVPNIKNEKQLFALLGITYRTPEERQ